MLQLTFLHNRLTFIWGSSGDLDPKLAPDYRVRSVPPPGRSPRVLVFCSTRHLLHGLHGDIPTQNALTRPWTAHITHLYSSRKHPLLFTVCVYTTCIFIWSWHKVLSDPDIWSGDAQSKMAGPGGVQSMVVGVGGWVRSSKALIDGRLPGDSVSHGGTPPAPQSHCVVGVCNHTQEIHIIHYMELPQEKVIISQQINNGCIT